MATTPTDIDSEEAAAAWLYGLSPDGFVESRNQLVKELRADGRRELAAVVALLRRPTVLAGELNRVLRSDPIGVGALIDAALDVRDGHQDLLGGEEVDIAALQRAHRQAALELADRAERNYGEIHAIVESASLDESIHDRLRTATFAVEPTPQTGFDLLTPTATVTSLSDARAKRDARDAASTKEQAEAKAKKGLQNPPHDRLPTTPTSMVEREKQDAADAPDTDEPSAVSEATKQAALVKAGSELEAAMKARQLAERRLEAAEKVRAKAQDRVIKIETQLNAATSHLSETETKYTAAQAATARSGRRLDDVKAVLDDLER